MEFRHRSFPLRSLRKKLARRPKKSDFPLSSRHKAGAVKFADSPEEAEKIAREILSMTVRNFPVDKLLVEKKLDIVQELYVSMTYDATHMAPVIIASSEGGVDIEEIARSHPEKILKHYVNILDGFHDYQSKEIWSQLGVYPNFMISSSNMMQRCWR